jgi:catechol 2,3-dioxygenase-like lactoylglutathione lyase family enzyme
VLAIAWHRLRARESDVMPERFLGFDHIDVRVRSLALVEDFYDAIMPQLGLVRKTFAYVDPDGEWHDIDGDEDYVAVEYFEDMPEDAVGRFIGFVEDPSMLPTLTRVAFRVEDISALVAWESILLESGARNVEYSSDMHTYPALYFEDPAGTKLELCARKPRSTT